ncbi:MAG TPA: hypothetical protein VFQ77_14525 [Pseudonocardiaceae bacterium]|nr:hypothetical protein [Pseudonocardiaceae bacterium]
MSLWDRLRRWSAGHELPTGCTATLEPGERVIAVAALAGGGHLVLTQLGAWVPEGAVVRRVGWHLVSKAVWDRRSLLLTEAVSTGTAGQAVLLTDLPPRRFTLAEPGRVPEVVRERVTRSIRSSQHVRLPGGGAWFVQRRVPGRDGVVLQVRADPGTAPDAVHQAASNAAAHLPVPESPG